MIEDEVIEEFQDYASFKPGTVYVLVAMARKKENTHVTENTQMLMRETATNEDQIRENIRRLEKESEIHEGTFRLYFKVNRRDGKKASFILRDELNKWTEQLLHGNDQMLEKYETIGSEFRSILQKEGCRDESHFLFDLDDVTEGEIKSMRHALEHHTEILLERPTPNGHHFITEGFNFNEMNTNVDYELKFDGMTFIGFAER